MAGERAIIGIDPGLDGALARYWPGSNGLQVVDMPTVTIVKGTTKKRRVDEVALARIMDDWAPTSTDVWLELVNAMPSIPDADGHRRSMGTQSSFVFGLRYGLIRGVCAANFLRIHDVTPGVWKKALGVRGDKNQSRARATVHFPEHAQHWPLVKHDGRAEAALIAVYGAMQLAPGGRAAA